MVAAGQPKAAPWLRASRNRPAQCGVFLRPIATPGPPPRPAPMPKTWWQAMLSELESYLNGLLPEMVLLIRLHKFVGYVAAQAAPRLGTCS